MELSATSVHSETQHPPITAQPHGLRRWWMRHHMQIGLASMAGSAILLCIIAVILLPIAVRNPSEEEEKCTPQPPFPTKARPWSTVSPGSSTNTSLRIQSWKHLREADVIPWCAGSAAWTSQAVTVAGSRNGASSLSAANLNSPSDLLIDSEGNLFVADSDNNRVVYWSTNATESRTAAGTGTAGSWTNLLKRPAALVVWNDQLYVSDLGNYRILAFPLSAEEDSPDGVTIVGQYGAGPALNQINAVHSMAVDEVRDILYLADSENHRVLKWNPAEKALQLVVGTGMAKSDKTSFNLPLGVTVDGTTGALYVADCRNHRVQRFDLSSQDGITVAGGRGEGIDPAQLRLPSGVTLDAVGNVYVADTGNQRIVQWLVHAQQGRVIAGTGTPGDSQTQLNQPVQLRFDMHHQLYVVDRYNHRIQRFDLTSDGC